MTITTTGQILTRSQKLDTRSKLPSNLRRGMKKWNEVTRAHKNRIWKSRGPSLKKSCHRAPQKAPDDDNIPHKLGRCLSKRCDTSDLKNSTETFIGGSILRKPPQKVPNKSRSSRSESPQSYLYVMEKSHSPQFHSIMLRSVCPRSVLYRHKKSALSQSG